MEENMSRRKEKTIKRKPIRKFIRKRIRNVRGGVRKAGKIGRKSVQHLQNMQSVDLQQTKQTVKGENGSIYAIDRVENTIQKNAYRGIQYTEKSGRKSVVKILQHRSYKKPAVNGKPLKKADTADTINRRQKKRTIKKTAKTETPVNTTSRTLSAKEKRRFRKGRRVTLSNKKKVSKSKKVLQVTGKVLAAPVRGGIKVGGFSIKVITKVIKGAHAAMVGILAFGWVLVLSGIIISLFALLMQSPLGIFFSMNSTEGDQQDITLQSIISDIDEEYQRRIETIQAENPADEIRITGNRSSWKEVLSVYAVKVSMDLEDPQDVLSFTETKALHLKEVYWEMNDIQYEVSEETNNKQSESEENEESEMIEILWIHRICKNYEEMMEIYGFEREQRDMVAELMDAGNENLWNEVDMGAIYVGIDLRWPLDGYTEVSSPFGYRTNPFTGELELHRGVDIPAPEGTPVHAAADGRVVIAGGNDSYGNYVKIDHGEGLMTLYAHNSALNVKVGQVVQQGDVIAYVGSTGDSTGNHCHWEVEKDGKVMEVIS